MINNVTNTSLLGSRAPAVHAKWKKAAVAGFQAVPDLLLKNQAALELSGTDLVVLLNILMHWWYPEQKPFPRPTTIARRIGTNVRTVQRSIQQLVELGLIERVKATSKGTVLDPSALVEKLNELAEEDRDYQIRLQKQQTA